MVLFEIHQWFKGHFLNEFRVSFKNGFREKGMLFTVPLDNVSIVNRKANMLKPSLKG